jgi:hypothetical protein
MQPHHTCLAIDIVPGTLACKVHQNRNDEVYD